MAHIIAKTTGINAEATASAKVDAGANLDIAYGVRGGEWNSEVLASIIAEATAKMEFTTDGLKTELGTRLGPIISASTKIGTDRSHIGIGVQAGGASAVN